MRPYLSQLHPRALVTTGADPVECLGTCLAQLVEDCPLVALEQRHTLVHAPYGCLRVIYLHRLAQFGATI
jgi:hypothetical protein